MAKNASSKVLVALEARAKKGDALALHELYLAYAEGKRVTRDTTKAMAFLRQAAEGGHALSQRVLANETYGTDHEGSLAWALKAAAQGDGPAMVHAARRLIAGRHATPDVRRALELYERAAALGEEEALEAVKSERLRERATEQTPAETLEDAARAVGLGRQIKRLQELAETSVRLVSNPCSESDLAVAASKLGGLPDLPPRTQWPERAGRPLTFLAQLNLEAIAEHAPEGTLPASGLLAFFYDSEEQPWGNAEEGDGWRVLFHPTNDSKAKLARRKAPARASTFQPCSLETFAELTLPPGRSARARTLPEKSLELYHDLEQALWRDYRRRPLDDGKIHRALGHPDAIQGDMARRIEYSLAGADLEKPTKSLEAGAATWRHLLQIDSDDAAGMMWGDLGRLYFWIRESDLAARKFENVWLQLQCG